MKKTHGHIFTIIFLIGGAIILLIAEFIPWVSQIYSPWYFFELYLKGMELRAYIYIFPIISSIIIIMVGILLLINKSINKGYISLVLFIALSLTTLFLFEMYSENGIYLYNSYGFFIGISGFGIIFWGLFYMLIQESPESNQSEQKI